MNNKEDDKSMRVNFNFWDESGVALVWYTFTLFVLIGFAALVIDVGNLYLSRRQAVTAADAAALAGAVELKKNNPNINDIRDQAKSFAEKNGARIENLQNDVTISGLYMPSRVTVKVTKEVQFIFAKILGFEGTNVHAVASAGFLASNGLVPFGKVYEEDEPFTSGQEINLKFEKWQDSGLGPGNFGYVAFPGQTGGDDLKTDLSYGYKGVFPFPLTTIETEDLTLIGTEPGQKTGPLVDAMEARMSMIPQNNEGELISDFIGEDGKPTLDKFIKPNNEYDTGKIYEKNCPLVIFVPLVNPPRQENRKKAK